MIDAGWEGGRNPFRSIKFSCFICKGGGGNFELIHEG